MFRDILDYFSVHDAVRVWFGYRQSLYTDCWLPRVIDEDPSSMFEFMIRSCRHLIQDFHLSRKFRHQLSDCYIDLMMEFSFMMLLPWHDPYWGYDFSPHGRVTYHVSEHLVHGWICAYSQASLRQPGYDRLPDPEELLRLLVIVRNISRSRPDLLLEVTQHSKTIFVDDLSLNSSDSHYYRAASASYERLKRELLHAWNFQMKTQMPILPLAKNDAETATEHETYQAISLSKQQTHSTSPNGLSYRRGKKDD